MGGRHAHLRGSRRVDQVGHGLGLEQVEPAIQVGAQRELAWPRQARAACDARLEHGIDDDRTAVRADLGGVFSGEGMRRDEGRDDR